MSYDLYGNTPPHVDTDTSREAARAIEPSVTRLALMVHGFVAAQGGATCDEAEAALNLAHQTCSARVRELVLHGRLHDSGQRRKTRSGRRAIVWEIGPGGPKPAQHPLAKVIQRARAQLKRTQPVDPRDVRALLKAAERSLKWANPTKSVNDHPRLF